MDFQTIKKLTQLLKENKLSEVTIQRGEDKVTLKQELTGSVAQPSASGNVVEETNDKNKAASGTNDRVRQTITAPSVGVFYAAKSPNDPPFIKEGEQIKKGDPICIIEAMKALNEVKADKSGTVAKILVEDGESVEYGQELIQLK